MTPPRHCLSFSASARNANTSPTGRAMVMVFDSSGIDLSSGGDCRELLQSLVPSRAIRRYIVAGWEPLVGDDDLGPSTAEVMELDGHERLVIGCGRPGVPPPRVHKQCGWIDRAVGAGHRHQRPATGRLHHEPVRAAGPEVDLRVRAGEGAGPPPPPQLLRFGPVAEHTLAWRSDDAANDHALADCRFVGH